MFFCYRWSTWITNRAWAIHPRLQHAVTLSDKTETEMVTRHRAQIPEVKPSKTGSRIDSNRRNFCPRRNHFPGVPRPTRARPRVKDSNVRLLMAVVELLLLANSKEEIGAGNNKARNNTGPLMYNLFVLTQDHSCCTVLYIKPRKKCCLLNPWYISFLCPPKGVAYWLSYLSKQANKCCIWEL